MRRTVGLLHSVDPASATARPVLAQLPMATDLRSLVDEYAGAGMPVRLILVGDPGRPARVRGSGAVPDHPGGAGQPRQACHQRDDAVLSAAGGAYLDPATTVRVLSAYRAGAAGASTALHLGDLTAREVDVLRLIGRGATNEEIADQLVITGATVKTHITRIFDKLGLRDRAAAIVFAFDHGLVQPAS